MMAVVTRRTTLNGRTVITASTKLPVHGSRLVARKTTISASNTEYPNSWDLHSLAALTLLCRFGVGGIWAQAMLGTGREVLVRVEPGNPGSMPSVLGFTPNAVDASALRAAFNHNARKEPA